MRGELYRSALVILIFFVLYFFIASLMSSPYYHLFEIKIQNKESYSLESKCVGTKYNVVKPEGGNEFTVYYIEDKVLEFLTVIEHLNFDDIDIVLIPLTGNDDFYVLKENDLKIDGRIVLISNKYRISIGFSERQFYGDFVQKLIERYDDCLSNNFHGGS